MESSSNKTHSIYLFSSEFFKGHSLLKLDIGLPEQEDGDCVVFTPQIIRQFYPCNRRRLFMGCGQFGSQLFILGGVVLHEGDDEYVNDHFPLDVMVFDTHSNAWSNVPDMNYPKIDPIMFEVAGKLYVLGSFRSIGPNAHIKQGRNIFEVYDPNDKTWKILIPPPFEYCNYIHSWGFSVVLDSTTVIVKGDADLYTFNPTTYEWKFIPRNYSRIFPFGCLDNLPSLIGDYLYWPQSRGEFVKIGPILDPMTVRPAIVEKLDMDTKLFPIDAIRNQCSHYPMLIHLGDSRICLLESDALCRDENGCDQFDIRFNTYIYQLIPEENSLRAKCLHSESFTVCNGTHSITVFSSYHLITKPAGGSDKPASSSEISLSKKKRKKNKKTTWTPWWRVLQGLGGRK